MSQTSVLPSEIEKLGEVIRIPRDSIRPMPGQPRKFFDQLKLKELATSIKAIGQQVPGLVRKLESNGSPHQFELVDGQRRWYALEIAGIPKMKVVVIDIEDEDHQFLISVVANFGRAEHGPMEIADAITRFREKGKTVEEIAEVFARSGAWVYQYLKIVDKLDVKVQQMMSQEIAEDDRLTFSMALIIADVPMKLQKGIAKTIVGKKLKMVQAKDYIKKQGKKHGFSVGNPERTPRKDYNLLHGFIERTQRQLRVLNQSPLGFFAKMFEFRGQKDHDQMVGILEENITGLQALAATIRRAQKQEA
ncbi:MAG: ParB/RepB/Spo0J family partition protein [bacterium]|nr:ParB/RepB/Spo0J family partition protein [bacterium]